MRYYSFEGCTVFRPGEAPTRRDLMQNKYQFEYTDAQGYSLNPPSVLFATRISPIEALVTGQEYIGWHGLSCEGYSICPFRDRQDAEKWVEDKLWSAGAFDIR